MTMNTEQYRILSARTLSASPTPELIFPRPALLFMSLGLMGEAGDVIELLKKHIGHGRPVDPEKLLHELGDVCWYLAAMYSISYRGWEPKPPQPSSERSLLELAALLGQSAGEVSSLAGGFGAGAELKKKLQVVEYAVRQIADIFGIAFEDVLQANVDKLEGFVLGGGER
jgi:hypothetical protein